MECFLFSDLRICLPSLFLCAWSSSIPFLPFVFYLFFCWIYAVVLVLCLGIRFQKWLPDFIHHCILHQLLRSCLPGLRAFTLCTYLPDKEASLIKKEYCRCGSHPLQVTSSRVRPHLSRMWATLAPFSQNFGVGHSGSWPPLHCGDLTSSHRRLFLMPHCTLRPSHLSVGGNAWRLEIVG